MPSIQNLLYLQNYDSAESINNMLIDLENEEFEVNLGINSVI